MPRKEVHFFDRRFHEGLEWYEQVFSGAERRPRIGEATPNYLYDGAAIERMAEVLPSASLIAVLRDPVDRAYSHYWMHRVREREPRSFEDAVDDELRDGPSPETNYLDRGRYLVQLRRVLEHYQRDGLEVVLFDDLKADPSAVFSGACRFLGIDDSTEPEIVGEQVNRFVAYRSMRLKRVRRRMPNVFRFRRAVARLNARTAVYPPMPAEIRHRLTEFFAPDNEALGCWLGRDLSSWQGASRQIQP